MKYQCRFSIACNH